MLQEELGTNIKQGLISYHTSYMESFVSFRTARLHRNSTFFVVRNVIPSTNNVSNLNVSKIATPKENYWKRKYKAQVIIFGAIFFPNYVSVVYDTICGVTQ